MTDELVAWEASLGMRGSIHFVNIILCPPLSTTTIVWIVVATMWPPCPHNMIHCLFPLAHWAWPFLILNNQTHQCHIPTNNMSKTSLLVPNSKNIGWFLKAYIWLCREASHHSIGYLQQPCHPASQLGQEIPPHWVFDKCVALLHYDFLYANFICSMSWLYMYQGQNHAAIWNIMTLYPIYPKHQVGHQLILNVPSMP